MYCVKYELLTRSGPYREDQNFYRITHEKEKDLIASYSEYFKYRESKTLKTPLSSETENQGKDTR